MYTLFKQEAAKKVGKIQGIFICIIIVLILYSMFVNFVGINFSWISLGFFYMHGIIVAHLVFRY